MRRAPGADDVVEIDVAAISLIQARIKMCGGFTAGLAHFIRFQCPLDDIGNRAVFAPRKPVSKITRLGAAHGKLWFGYGIVSFRPRV